MIVDYLTFAVSVLALIGGAMGWWIMHIHKTVKDAQDEMRRETDSFRTEFEASKDRIWKNIDELKATSNHLDKTMVEVSTNLRNLDRRVEEVIGLLKQHFQHGPAD